jgi:hypothetical protein
MLATAREKYTYFEDEDEVLSGKSELRVRRWRSIEFVCGLGGA